MIMVESEGVSEIMDPWRIEIPAKFVKSLGPDKLSALIK